VLSERTEYTGKTIKSIEYYGLSNVSPDSLNSMLLMQVGEKLSDSALNQDVINLYSSGYFSSVTVKLRSVDEGSVEVFFEVVELPQVKSVSFIGVEEIYEADLISFIPIKEGDVFSLQKVKDGVKGIKDRYKLEGFFFAEVWYRIEKLDQNAVRIYYIVDEGDNIPVSKINITGPVRLNPDEIIKVLEQKEEGILEEGIFNEAQFETDKYKIVGYAKSNGYVDAEIDESGSGYEIRWRNPSKPEKGRVVVITYKLMEGDIRYFGGYSVEHDPDAINRELNPPERKQGKPLNPLLKPAEILDSFEYTDSEIGEVYDEGRYFRDRNTIQEIYSQFGYVFSQVQPEYINFPLTEEVLQKYETCLKNEPRSAIEERCRKEAGYLNLTALRERLADHPKESGRIHRHTHFQIREHGLAYIETIIVKGMEKTKESVIRRELLIKEGQLFNSALVNRSREKLVNLGYFKEVNLQMRPGSDDTKMVLVIDVKEQPTGTISIGGGYGTTSGFSIFTELGNTNLNGTGQAINGRLQFGPTQKTFSITWRDPWIYERCLENTGSFWRNKQKEFDSAQDYSEIERLAGSLKNEYAEYGKTIRSYVIEAGPDQSIEALDRVKSKIRGLIVAFVSKEEECYQSMPNPWALSLSAYYQSYSLAQSSAYSLQISDDKSGRDFFEGSTYDISSVGVGFGIFHNFGINWGHYHQYRPYWSSIGRPSPLVNDSILKQAKMGWQFKSALRNGIIFNNVDNIYNPTYGNKIDLSVEFVGQMLGGEDHYNKYEVSISKYWWWFDYTLGGLFRKNTLRRWRVVQELRFSGIFMHEAAPIGKKQDKTTNAYLEYNDRLYLGGYESLRGYSYGHSSFPYSWRDGANHMVLGGAELRFPLEPTMFWLVAFFDSGVMFDNVGEFTGVQKEQMENYEETINTLRSTGDPRLVFLQDKFNLSNLQRLPYDSVKDWNDPRRAVLSERNFSLDRALYSWGFGLRIQIPMMPLRLFFAQKLYYDHGAFKPHPGDKKFEFVFGIGDFRY
jgi:outer membrane protein assembly factor BamA